MQTQNNNQNGNQEPTFYQKNRWWIWILTGLIVLFFFFRKLEFKNPFFNEDYKKDTAIINAINNNGNKIVGAINDNGSKIDKVGEKVDKNTETNKAGFQQVVDTLSAMKRKCISCKEKPKPIKKPCPPVVKVAPPVQKDTTVNKKTELVKKDSVVILVKLDPSIITTSISTSPRPETKILNPCPELKDTLINGIKYIPYRTSPGGERPKDGNGNVKSKFIWNEQSGYFYGWLIKKV